MVDVHVQQTGDQPVQVSPFFPFFFSMNVVRLYISTWMWDDVVLIGNTYAGAQCLPEVAIKHTYIYVLPPNQVAAHDDAYFTLC